MIRFSRLKSKILLAVFVLIGAFLFCLDPKSASAYHATSSYNKLFNDTLTSQNWNDLFSDFVNTWLPTSMNGPLGIATSSPASGLEVNGIIRGTSLFSSGNVGFGTNNPTARLEVVPTSGYSILAGNFKIGNVALPTDDSDAATKGYVDSFVASATTTMGTFWSGLLSGDIWNTNSGNVGIGTTSPIAKLNVFGNTKLGMSFKAPLKTLDIAGNINFNAVDNLTVAQVTGLTLTDAGSGNIPAGTYYYDVVFYTAEGDTGSVVPGASHVSITLSSASRVTVGNIPTSPDPRVIGRKVYRSQAGTVGDYYYLYNIATIANNTDTTYTDNTTTYNASDWMYNKVNTTAGLTYVNGIKMQQLSTYVTAAGYNALVNLTRGSTAAAFGSSALVNNTTGDGNSAFGHSAGSSVTTGGNNVYMGYAAGQGNQTGSANTAVGINAHRNNSLLSSSYNSAFGGNALGGGAASNNGNVAFGYNSGNNSQGSFNTFLGSYAGNKAAGAAVGNYNIIIGAYSGSTVAAGSNILIGDRIELTNPGVSNQLNIGNLLFATGMNGTGTTLSTGNIGIGTTTPIAKLEIVPASGYSLLAGNFKIGNVALPLIDSDAATKGYVDSFVASYVAVATGTIANVAYYVGITPSTYTGDNNGSAGYMAAENACKAAYASSTVCTPDNFLNSIAAGLTMPTEDVWIFAGPPGYTAAANDCEGRSVGTTAAYGTYWQQPMTGRPQGRGLLMRCNNALRLACCR